MQQQQYLFELNLLDKTYKYTSLSLLHPKCDVCQFFDAHGYKQSHMTQVPWLSVLLPCGLNPAKRNKPLVPKSTDKAKCYVKHYLDEGNLLKLTVQWWDNQAVVSYILVMQINNCETVCNIFMLKKTTKMLTGLVYQPTAPTHPNERLGKSYTRLQNWTARRYTFGYYYHRQAIKLVSTMKGLQLDIKAEHNPNTSGFQSFYSSHLAPCICLAFQGI